MNRNSQRGVALVITLIMLAIVLIMAVLFLGISRRERASVTANVELTTAKYAAETGQTRALAEIIAPITAQSNLLAYGMVVSTNLINPNGFQSGLSSFTNVAYTYANGQPLSGNADIRLNQANLLYDPRPPVFVVNKSGTSEFLYYLDLNRNGRFDTNGYQPVIGANGQRTGQTNSYIGDPEWIGILEHPDQPHSGSNRFIARYAFLVVPAGRTLDINYIHNNARDPGAGPNFNIAFSRNQGVGSWEINLAAFLRDLNTNYWLGDPVGYHYTPYFGVPSASGRAFDDALSILSYRCNRDFRTLNSVGGLFGSAGKIFENDLIDEYGDDRPATGLQLTAEGSPDANDRTNKLWFGSENTNGFTRIDELFDPNKTSLPFVNTRLRPALTNSGTYNQNTYYRLMAQLGTDSLPANRLTPQQVLQLGFPPSLRLGKLNLNYDNVNYTDPNVPGFIDPSLTTNLAPWTPIRFFTNAADLMLRSQSSSILSSLGVPVAATNTLSITNIPIYPANLYSSGVHRLLQLAANIYDATTNGVPLATGSNAVYAPSVFRPLIANDGRKVWISGYTNEVRTNFLSGKWFDSSQTNAIPLGTNAVNVYGVPLVIGAKKGLPNFNEFLLRTSAQVTRRLEARKRSPQEKLAYRQSYQFSITNTLAMEAWNSYTQAFPRPVTLMLLTNRASMVISNGNTTLAVPDPRRPLAIATNIAIGAWAGWNPGDFSGPSFQVPMNTNVTTFPEAAVLSDGTIEPAGTNSISFEHFYDFFPVPDLKLYITNRLVFALVAQDLNGVPRLVDFVNLDRMTGGMDIMRELVGRTNAFGDVGLHPGSFWITNRTVANLTNMTWGITNQVFVSTNDALAKGDWSSYSDDPTAGQDKPKAVDNFRKLLGLPPLFDTSNTNVTYGTFQVPFTPTRKLDQKLSWQANDPLVHYHIEDLSDGRLTSVTNLQVLTPKQRLDDSNIGQINDPRYRPWGGNPKNLSGSPKDYDLAVKDPLIAKSDDWNFPTNKFPNIGWLGRVHRGTPWQTVYLKSQVEKLDGWLDWAGQAGRADTHPTNDWHLLSLFTTAPNDAAARGLLSVNQTNIAAWSAVLSGVPVLSNGLANLLLIEPASPQLYQIVSNINATRLQMPNQVFPDLGSVLRSPALTVASPFLNTSVAPPQKYPLISDALYERIPQQILSLLKDDEPYVVIYAFGQSLKPASDSVVTAPGVYRGLCTNYQVTAEVATKTAVRIEETRQPNNRPNIYKAVVESYGILPAE